MVLFLFNSLILTRVQCLSISWAPIYLLIYSTKSSLSGLIVASLKLKILFTASILEARGLVKLGRLFVDDLALSSWWISLSTKFDVSGIMDLVEDMATYAKRAMRPNNFGIPFSLFYLSWIIFLRVNPEVRRFTYSGIRRKDCEGTLCYYPLDEARVAASRLTSVGFCLLL